MKPIRLIHISVPPGLLVYFTALLSGSTIIFLISYTNIKIKYQSRLRACLENEEKIERGSELFALSLLSPPPRLMRRIERQRASNTSSASSERTVCVETF